MKKFIRWIMGLLLGAVLALGGVVIYSRLYNKVSPPSQLVLPDAPAAMITHLAGPVFLVRDRQLIPASSGDKLETGDVIKVTDGAMAQVQIANRGTAKIGSNTLIKFQQILGTGQGMELRTEILTGSLYYKMDKLNDEDVMVIEADGTLYEIRGTRFFIERGKTGTVLAVGEGAVSVEGNRIQGQSTVMAGEELRILTASSDPGAVTPLSKAAATKLEEDKPHEELPFPSTQSVSRVFLSTVPPDAVIYLDGLKTGTGSFSGAFFQGTELSFLIRRQGFQDLQLTILADGDVNRTVQLKPLGIEDSLDEPVGKNSLLQGLWQDYQDQLTTLKKELQAQQQGEVNTRELLEQERLLREQNAAALRQAQEALEEEKRRHSDVLAEELNAKQALLEELDKKESNIQRLQELLSQIRTISEEENP